MYRELRREKDPDSRSVLAAVTPRTGIPRILAAIQRRSLKECGPEGDDLVSGWPFLENVSISPMTTKSTLSISLVLIGSATFLAGCSSRNDDEERRHGAAGVYVGPRVGVGSGFRGGSGTATSTGVSARGGFGATGGFGAAS
jgi:hypothetical protein